MRYTRVDKQIMADGIIVALSRRLLQHSGFLSLDPKEKGKQEEKPMDELTNQNSETPIKTSTWQRFKTKKIGLMGMLMLLVAGSVLGAVLVHTFTITFNVNENIACTNTDVTLDGSPSATTTQTVTCTNSGLADQNVKLEWSETSNPNAVQYTTSAPSNFVVPASSSTNKDLTLTVGSASPTGTVIGQAQVSRV